jgi:hypothetical protein
MKRFSRGFCIKELCDWRASLVPAAAVIPTPRVCMRDAAVKTSVVVLCKSMTLLSLCVNRGADGDCCIQRREMKCLDPLWTERGEGCSPVSAR